MGGGGVHGFHLNLTVCFLRDFYFNIGKMKIFVYSKIHI